MLDQSDRIAAVNTPLGPNVLALRGFTATETLSQLPRFELDLLSEQPNLSPNALLGKAVGLRLNLGGGQPRFFHAHVIQFGRAPGRSRYFPYQATVVPWLWFLTRTTNCRVFQKKSVPDIVQQVFRDRQFSDFELRLSGSYTPWDYCVQYRESDFQFVSRLLEQEGITYFFRHEAGKHTLVLADSPGAHQPFPGYATILYRPPGNQHAEVANREYVREWLPQTNHLAGVYTHTDYDFEKPRSDLRTRSPLPGSHAHADLEVYDYPGEYAQHQDGDTWARVRMEEIQAQRDSVSGWGDARGVAAGSTFQFGEPPDPSQAGRYLVTSVRHALRGNEFETTSAPGEAVYDCQFLAQPASRPFRPPRSTPKPRVHGVQTAVVVGPKGEEVYTDKYGRIKVQFHWDREGKRDENSSLWIRVAQLWAGRRWGAAFTPRIGQEVVVDFLEGDPDQPLVIGCLHNADQMPAYLGGGPDGNHPDDPKVSGLKTCSTRGGQGFNELRFDDNKGKEQLFLHAERDLDVRVKHDARVDVGRDVHVSIGTAEDGSLTAKATKDLNVWAKKQVNVEADDQFYVQVGSGGQCQELRTQTGAHNLVTAQEFTCQSLKVVLQAPEICLNAGGSFITLTPAGIFITGPMVFLNSGGAAVPASPVPPVTPKEPDPADKAKSGSPSNG